jgi:Transposase
MARMGSSRGRRRARRQFSDELMARVVRLMLDEGKTVGAVARELDLTPSPLGCECGQRSARYCHEGEGLLRG